MESCGGFGVGVNQFAGINILSAVFAIISLWVPTSVAWPKATLVIPNLLTF